tara:strand:- start:688 stop:1101 length:414 start_codon:yes stop_codon:yes gene_type:complete
MATDAKTGQNIFGRYGAGLHNVGSYQSSGWPWLTGSTLVDNQEWKIDFPMVTKSITIIQSGSGGAKAHFVSTSSLGNVVSGRHYVSFEADNDSLTLNVKCTELYISCVDAGTWEVAAELTNIPASAMFTLTGSGHTD